MRYCLIRFPCRRSQAAALAAAVLCIFLAAGGGARGATSVEILATDPASPAVLGRTQAFSLRVGYAADEPIVISAHAFLNGHRAPAMNGGVARRGPDRGEVLLWLGYYQPQQIDRVAVSAATLDGRPLVQTDLAVNLAWTGKPTGARTPPAWVRSLQAEKDRRERAEYEAIMNSPSMEMMDLVVIVMMCTIPGYFVLQGWLVWRLRRGWRAAAAAPLWPMGAVLLYTLYALWDGSNLFPVVLIFTAPLAFGYLLIIAVLHRLRRRAAGA